MRKAMVLGMLALIVATIPASAEFFGCNDKDRGRGKVLGYYTEGVPSRATAARAAVTHDLSAQSSRPRITVHPRTTSPGPNAKRYCRAWLAKEYRPSGTVIVPREQCWWQ